MGLTMSSIATVYEPTTSSFTLAALKSRYSEFSVTEACCRPTNTLVDISETLYVTRLLREWSISIPGERERSIFVGEGYLSPVYLVEHYNEFLALQLKVRESVPLDFHLGNSLLEIGKTIQAELRSFEPLHSSRHFYYVECWDDFDSVTSDLLDLVEETFGLYSSSMSVLGFTASCPLGNSA